MEDILIILVMFGSVFGVFYLHYSTRNRERMALIEKGADVSIFYSKKEKSKSPIWKILLLNIALLSMGIGVGVGVGGFIGRNCNMSFEMPASVFFFAGAGLVIGYFITNKIDKKN